MRRGSCQRHEVCKWSSESISTSLFAPDLFSFPFPHPSLSPLNLSVGISLCVRSSCAHLEFSALACSGLLASAFSLRLAMGDFPRWVDRADVDSQAMYSAYLSYDYTMKKKFKDQGVRPLWWGSLKMVLHRRENDELSAVPRDNGGCFRHVFCTQRPCLRCDEGRGGYQFRWYCRYWAKAYNELAREGAWKAPEADSSCTDDPSVRFWKPAAS